MHSEKTNPRKLILHVAVLFGAVKGTVKCLLNMAMGSFLSFFLGRFILSGWSLMKFHRDAIFKKMDMLSCKHPLIILVLSRIVSVVSYSIDNSL